jgi:hypothetical protein
MEQPENTSLTSKKDPGLLSPAQRWTGLYTVLLMLLLAAFLSIISERTPAFSHLNLKLPRCWRYTYQ